MNKLQAVRGMNDVLPTETPVWQYLEYQVEEVLSQYGYKQIRLPIVEPTQLFKRSIGDATDIVEKEMYTFEDRNGDSLSLRPEGTASCVRAVEQHGIAYNQPQRLWYQGPMFRHERPQKGRYRQFHQIGAECFGYWGPDIDAELILMTARLWKNLGLYDHVQLELNSLGSSEERQAYKQALVDYLQPFKEELDEDSARRLETNPLRILDSKNERTQEIVADAPVLSDFFGEDTQTHFNQLRADLEQQNIAYVYNPRLVRGLDYYNLTVFEWTTTSLGAQGTVCAGGRYDGLVEQLGGKANPGVGFAMGVERLILMIETLETLPKEVYQQVDIYMMYADDATYQASLAVAEKIRDQHTYNVVLHAGGGSLKSQMKKADKSSAQLGLLIGVQELDEQQIVCKPLKGQADQVTIRLDELDHYLEHLL